MNQYRTGSRKGFSLVELLAVVLVLAVLAGVAIPLYTSQRKSAAGRTCKANLAAISSALAGYALRNNAYPAALSTLVGAAEGLTAVPTCPIDGSSYIYTVNADKSASVCCPNNLAAAANSHGGYGGTAGVNTATAPTGDWGKLLATPAADNLP
jgi:prepilin-type N-terminal cleavage/methylation domain-containing protein